ncbi:MAG: DUF2029 domain-containing protein [Chloroflexi bacterium]|nr:DUF2029 domain-containing protein [Chloroflexota bacterium]
MPVLPLVFLPFSLAQAAWMAAGFFVIIATALRQAQGWPPTVIGGWLLRAARAEPGTQSLSNAFAACSFEGVEGSRPAWAIAVIVSALAFYPSVRDLALAQFALLPFACIGGTLWALEARHDRLAGVTLALACAKPQMVFLIAPFTLLWAWRKRRAFVVGFLTGGAILLFVSLALWPAWVGEWLARLDEYRRYVTQLAPLSLLPEPLVWLAALTAVGGTAWLIRQTLRGARDLASAVNWLIPLTLLIAPSTSVSDQVLLLIPLMGFAASLRNGRRALFLLGVAVLPWGWFWLTQSNGHEGAAMIWPLPVATLGILICQEAFSRKPS